MVTASTQDEETVFRGMPGRRLGTSGLVVPTISLGCWNNFGAEADEEVCKQLVFTAFDRGVTHFDLANNYGPPPGSAEDTFGEVLSKDLAAYRDEMVISTKAGYYMWPGPYGDHGSRKYLIASLDQSLRRLQVEYVDIFYHHRPDSQTRLDESLGALDTAVRMGKALYSGISNYGAEQTRRAVSCAEANGFVPLLVNQSKYNMFQRDIEDELLSVSAEAGMGVVVYSPLAQGLLTNRYLTDIPPGSRAGTQTDYSGVLQAGQITEAVRTKVQALHEVASRRGQSLAQLAIAWAIRDREGGRTAGAIVGASSVEQLSENLHAADGPALSEDELKEIDSICH
jgi:L-glyceraldehyde 3-phosphate reductase